MKITLGLLPLTISAVAVSANAQDTKSSEFSIQANVQLPFPKWLTDFTGLTSWPGVDPPYIPLDFIDFQKIPKHIPAHESGQCATLANNFDTCSFDCHNCVSSDDVYTCPQLSQTFDDGPSVATPKLLDSLKSKATFFILGINAVRLPDVYRNTVERGHVVGSHTWSHKFLPSLKNEEIIAQIEWSIWAMNATHGHLPKWFRPPYGGIDNRVRAILRQFGMQAVLWDFDTFDWKLMNGGTAKDEQTIYDNVRKFKNANQGHGLILEHDVFGRTVDVALKVNDIIGPNQLTVPQCVGGLDYIKRFDIEN